MADHIVVVGASLAGLRGAEAARRAGYTGALTIVGDEPYRPYDRPPLSKRVLSGDLPADGSPLPNLVALDADWRLGTMATGLDLAARSLTLGDGTRLGFDRLLIACGARAKPWPDAAEAALAGVHTLRGRDDAAALRAALAAGPRRVLVIGAGFIGCEVASCCRAIGLAVTVVDPNPMPLARVMGTWLGAKIAGMLKDGGVDFRAGTRVEALEGNAARRLRGAALSDGTRVGVEVAVVALGAIRDTGWLQGSGLRADDEGIACDGFCRTLNEASHFVEGICAAGDVARWPHPLYGGRLVALEHWGNAVEQGAFAGRVLAGDPSLKQPYGYLPAFWSSQFGTNIKSVGLADLADAVAIVRGDPKARRFIAAFGREGRTVAAFSFDSARWLPAYAEAVLAGASFPPLLGGVDQPELHVVDPGFPAPRQDQSDASGSGRPSPEERHG